MNGTHAAPHANVYEVPSVLPDQRTFIVGLNGNALKDALSSFGIPRVDSEWVRDGVVWKCHSVLATPTLREGEQVGAQVTCYYEPPPYPRRSKVCKA